MAAASESAAQLEHTKKIRKACDLYISKARELVRQQKRESKRTPEESAAIRTKTPAFFRKKGDFLKREVTNHFVPIYHKILDEYHSGWGLTNLSEKLV